MNVRSHAVWPGLFEELQPTCQVTPSMAPITLPHRIAGPFEKTFKLLRQNKFSDLTFSGRSKPKAYLLCSVNVRRSTLSQISGYGHRNIHKQIEYWDFEYVDHGRPTKSTGKRKKLLVRCGEKVRTPKMSRPLASFTHGTKRPCDKNHKRSLGVLKPLPSSLCHRLSCTGVPSQHSPPWTTLSWVMARTPPLRRATMPLEATMTPLPPVKASEASWTLSNRLPLMPA